MLFAGVAHRSLLLPPSLPHCSPLAFSRCSPFTVHCSLLIAHCSLLTPLLHLGAQLAAKYEEIYPPELRDLVYITDKAYTKEEILKMEEKMLKALEFKVTIASTHCFLVRYLKAAHADR